MKLYVLVWKLYLFGEEKFSNFFASGNAKYHVLLDPEQNIFLDHGWMMMMITEIKEPREWKTPQNDLKTF